MTTLHLQLVTPERTVLDEQVLSLSCPTTLGQITILPGHTPLVAELSAGELVARAQGGVETLLSVAGGFVQIKPGNSIIVLADAAKHVHEIDEQEIREAVARARARLVAETSLPA